MSFFSQAYDVVVVGAGPAGAAAALRLAQNGSNVALIDKAALPRYKPCGGGVVARVHRALPINVQSAIEKNCHSVDLRFHAANLHFHFNKHEPLICTTMRETFDRLLTLEAEKAGARTRFPCKALDFETNSDTIRLTTNKGILNTKFVIAADGALSTLARKGGWQPLREVVPALEWEIMLSDENFQRFNESARFDFDLIDSGYGWIFPKKTHLSVGLSTKHTNGVPLNEWMRRYLAAVNIDHTMSVEKHGWMIPICPRDDGFMKNRVLLIGDAAGLVDPLTGEGISAAIFSGQIAADALLEGQFEEESVRKLFEAGIKKKLLSELKFSRVLSNLIYEHPKIRRKLFAHLGEKLIRATAQVFLGEKSFADQLGNPLNYLKLLKRE